MKEVMTRKLCNDFFFNILAATDSTALLLPCSLGKKIKWYQRFWRLQSGTNSDTLPNIRSLWSWPPVQQQVMLGSTSYYHCKVQDTIISHFNYFKIAFDLTNECQSSLPLWSSAITICGKQSMLSLLAGGWACSTSIARDSRCARAV